LRLLVAILLRLFPARFRRTLGADLLAAFEDRWRESRRWGVAPGIIVDLVHSAFLERLSELHRAPDQLAEPEIRKGDSLMTTLGHDLRFAARMLRKAPGFTVVAILVLALGVGANTAMFSVINAVLLRPLPYQEPDQLVWLTQAIKWNPKDTDEITLTPDFMDWRKQNHVFTAMAAFNPFERTLTGAGDSIQVHAWKTSAALLPLLKAQPLLGRTFADNEDQTGRDQVAILTYGLWQQRFGGRSDVVGQSIRLDDQLLTVVGVLPRDFYFPLSEPVDLLMPLGKNEPVEMLRADGMSFNRNVVARLKPGITLAQARADMEVVQSHLPRPKMLASNVQMTFKMLTLRDRLVGDVRTALLTLLGAVGFLLLIACANVANLLLSRAVSRQRELAIRGALGASRSRLAKQLLVESLTLAALGCAGGLALAWWTRGAILGLLPRTIPGLESLPLDFRVLAFTMASVCASILIFGLGPALSGTSAVNPSLNAEGRAFSGGGGRQLWLRLLASAQMAIAIVLLTGGGLMLESFWNQRYRDLGFQADHLLAVPLHFNRARYPGGAKQSALIDGLLDSVANLPGVVGATAGTIPPGDLRGLSGNSFRIEGRPVLPMGSRPVSRQPSVSPSYFHVMGIPLLRGRGLLDTDTEGADPVVLVSETLARRYFPGEDPIGRRISVARNSWWRIAGIAGDVKTAGLAAAAEPLLYFPYHQLTAGFLGDDMGILVRSVLDPAAIAPEVRKRITQVDSNVTIGDMQTMDRHLNEAAARPRLAALLLGCFAALGLTLATVGLYGVMSFLVRWRVREIGIRLAIGAQPHAVLRMILAQSVKVMLAGVVVGTASALWLNRLMQGLLYGVSAADPLTFGMAIGFLTAVGLTASYLPARQASTVDPMATLRAE
jgi:putative ABC transport system permease protein